MLAETVGEQQSLNQQLDFKQEGMLLNLHRVHLMCDSEILP